MSGFGRVVVLSSAVSLLAPAVAAAQDVRVGVLGGIVFSNLANLTDAVDFGASSVDVKWRTGAVVGPFVSIGVNDKLAIQPEVLFATKGATATDGINELRIQLSYVDIPILARVTPAPDKPFYFLVGPSVNFNTSATAVDLVPEEMEEDIKDDIKGTEFGLVFGAGVTIRRFLIEGRYIAGLSNIADIPEIDESVRNRGIAIIAGVRF